MNKGLREWVWSFRGRTLAARYRVIASSASVAKPSVCGLGTLLQSISLSWPEAAWTNSTTPLSLRWSTAFSTSSVKKARRRRPLDADRKAYGRFLSACFSRPRATRVVGLYSRISESIEPATRHMLPLLSFMLELRARSDRPAWRLQRQHVVGHKNLTLQPAVRRRPRSRTSPHLILEVGS